MSETFPGSRAAIDHEKGSYLFPLPMTGETPRRVKALVLNPGQISKDIVLTPKDEDDDERVVGKGFVVNQPMEVRIENGGVHRWQERWMVSCSHAHAQRQKTSFQSRLDKAEDKLSKLKVKSKDSADSFRLKAEKSAVAPLRVRSHQASPYFLPKITVEPIRNYHLI